MKIDMVHTMLLVAVAALLFFLLAVSAHLIGR
jgi:hypothetical protein